MLTFSAFLVVAQRAVCLSVADLAPFHDDQVVGTVLSGAGWALTNVVVRQTTSF